jgi:hypothetical protein
VIGAEEVSHDDSRRCPADGPSGCCNEFFDSRLGNQAKAVALRLQLGRTELRAQGAAEATVAAVLHIQKQDSLIAVAWDSPAGRGHHQENDSEATL